jgi:hypothetical protein
VGRHSQSHFLKVVFHEEVSNVWGEWQTHRHSISLLVELAVEAEKVRT